MYVHNIRICYRRQMKLNNELNNMSWRVRPEEILLEVGRLFGSKIGLQQLNVEVGDNSWSELNTF